MKFKNRQQILALVSFAAIGLLASDRLILSPLAGSWAHRASRIAELKQSISQGSLMRDREQMLRSRWDHMRTNTLTNNVSAAENEVLKALDRWELASRVNITSKKPQWKRNSDDYMTFECQIDASGAMPSITRFLYELEGDPLALKVESVEITSRDSNGQQLSLALHVSALLLNPPPQQ